MYMLSRLKFDHAGGDLWKEEIMSVVGGVICKQFVYKEDSFDSLVPI